MEESLLITTLPVGFLTLYGHGDTLLHMVHPSALNLALAMESVDSVIIRAEVVQLAEKQPAMMLLMHNVRTSECIKNS